jgi:hypothetical protein
MFVSSEPALAEEGEAIFDLSPADAQLKAAEFIKRATLGCPCIHLKPSISQRVPTQYRIDAALENLIVLSPSDKSQAEVICPFGAIQDIYTEQDGESCFPAPLLRQLRPEERANLLMIVFSMGPFRMHRFFIIEESVQSRNNFLASLRILCANARMKPKSVSLTDASTDDAGTGVVSSVELEAGEAQQGSEQIAFLPKEIDGVIVLQEVGINKWQAVNEKARSSRQGLGYRREKDMAAQRPEVLEWGRTIEGVDAGNGWVQVVVPAEAAVG